VGGKRRGWGQPSISEPQKNWEKHRTTIKSHGESERQKKTGGETTEVIRVKSVFSRPGRKGSGELPGGTLKKSSDEERQGGRKRAGGRAPGVKPLGKQKRTGNESGNDELKVRKRGGEDRIRASKKISTKERKRWFQMVGWLVRERERPGGFTKKGSRGG